jgi:hypothetical protein
MRRREREADLMMRGVTLGEAIVMMGREREADLMMRGEGGHCDEKKREGGRSDDERSERQL